MAINARHQVAGRKKSVGTGRGGKAKKGTKGTAVAFISRTKAVRRLQLSLPDFRRLCILKGIYPREPKNKKKISGGDSGSRTYYHTKDIQYLSHEPLIRKFREFKVFLKRLKKASGKKQHQTFERLQGARPTLNINHIIKERYPTFTDAIRDLDDPLCMVALFAQMPKAYKVQNKTVKLCQRLNVEFQHFLIRTRSLEKVFFSIKGIYYQAKVLGQRVTWLSPYKFSMKVPTDVDFRVMDTFLLFYNKLLGFINFSLYTSQLGLRYPPRIDESKDKEDVGLNALILEEPEEDEKVTASKTVAATKADMKSISAAVKNIVKAAREDADTEDEEEEGIGDEDDGNFDEVGPSSFPAQIEGGEDAVADIDTMNKMAKEEAAFSKLFEGLWFYCSREVPREAMEFMIRCFGGHVSWQGVGIEDALGAGPFSETDPRITHHIVDRPSLPKTHLGRHYVQPQWIVDSINCRKLLPTAPYTIGAVLPPHLSPFGEEGDEPNFVPPDPTSAAGEDGEEIDNEVEEDTDDEELHRQELEEEATGVKKSKKIPKKQKINQDAKAAEEEREMAISMMSKKQARLYKQIKYGEAKKAKEKDKIRQKRKAAASESASKKKRAA